MYQPFFYLAYLSEYIEQTCKASACKSISKVQITCVDLGISGRLNMAHVRQRSRYFQIKRVGEKMFQGRRRKKSLFWPILHTNGNIWLSPGPTKSNKFK